MSASTNPAKPGTARNTSLSREAERALMAALLREVRAVLIGRTFVYDGRIVLVGGAK